MKLRTLRVDGFGRFSAEDFTFGPGLNVVVGPNEAGKSTLAAVVVASLYGLSRAHKDRWRPWRGDAYGATLTYETADGRRWEVRREFDRDSKGVRVYDQHGADAAARIGAGKSLAPGEAHLRIPLDVYLQTACVRQRSVALEPISAGAVSGALARALSGGPMEDAASGALQRLDEAFRAHVGTQRAHKNAPLKALREREEQERRAADAARAVLASLAALRERLDAERSAYRRDTAVLDELERRSRSLRAAHVRARLAGLTEYRNELAALQLARAAFDDVAAFSADRIAALEDAYHSWRAAVSVCEAAERDAGEERLNDAERTELEARRADAGRWDEEAFRALRSAAAHAEAARTRSLAAASDAAAQARGGEGAGAVRTLLAATFVAAVTDGAVASAHAWLWTVLASAVTVVLAVVALVRGRSQAKRAASAERRRRAAEAACAEERAADAAVARMLEPFGIASADELFRRRDRLSALSARELAAHRAQRRAATAREAADAEAQRFDARSRSLIPDAGGTREERRMIAQQRAARRRERDGLDASIAMLTVRRGAAPYEDDDLALQAEYEALLAGGIEPAPHDDPHTLRALERERAELDARAREAERRAASLEGELRAGEDGVPSVAALDESLAATRAQIARLESFGRAVALALEIVQREKDAAHRGFARRLEEYSTDVLASLTAGRYGEIYLDPTSLAIRVRVPETGRIEDLDRLSAGTRDQIALVVRFATARMFAEGLERPPLLLDDPFAFWDTARIGRCLPILVHAAREAQIILLTSSTELAEAARDAGAAAIHLASSPSPV